MTLALYTDSLVLSNKIKTQKICGVSNHDIKIEHAQQNTQKATEQRFYCYSSSQRHSEESTRGKTNQTQIVLQV